MKKLLVIALCLMFVPLVYAADRLTLTNDETLTPDKSRTMDWYIDYISERDKRLEVRYRYLDSTFAPIRLKGSDSNGWLLCYVYEQWNCRPND
jgi:hypothetical protein